MFISVFNFHCSCLDSCIRELWIKQDQYSPDNRSNDSGDKKKKYLCKMYVDLTFIQSPVLPLFFMIHSVLGQSLFSQNNYQTLNISWSKASHWTNSSTAMTAGIRGVTSTSTSFRLRTEVLLFLWGFSTTYLWVQILPQGKLLLEPCIQSKCQFDLRPNKKYLFKLIQVN